MMVAIVTNRSDLTADLGILAFQRSGVPYVRINTEDAVPVVGVRDEVRVGVCLGDRYVDARDFSAVWFRRPRYVPTGFTVAAQHRGFVVEEVRSAWRNLYRLLDTPLWVNHPENNQRAGNRLWVLEQARRAGLITPETLVTKSTQEAREFIAQTGPAAAKSVGPGYRDEESGVASFTTVFPTPDSLPEFLGPTPVLFQSYVQKTCDWRVTVMGQQIFAVRLLSQEVPGGEVDWRQATEQVPMELSALPIEVERSIRALLLKLDLQFAALDFVEDEAGRLVFLEVNANGQWGWIEQQAGVPLSDGLAQLMMSVI